MWKICLIGLVYIHLICAQCEDYADCYGRKQQTPQLKQQNVTAVTSHTRDAAIANATIQNRNDGKPKSFPREIKQRPITYKPLSEKVNLTGISAAWRPTAPPDTSTTNVTIKNRNDAVLTTGIETSKPYKPYDENLNLTSAASLRPPSPIVFPQESDDNAELPTELFSSKLFQHLSKATSNRNLLFSPLSLQLILSFIYIVSEGKLSEELANVLDFPKNRTFVTLQVQSLIKTPHNTNNNNTLVLANKIYYEERFGIVQQNVRILAEKYFSTEVEPVDFSAQREAAVAINSWVARKTNNLIKDLISPNDIGSDSQAMLVNTLYFKSEWQRPFSEYETYKEKFFASQNRSVMVDMMSTEDYFHYAEFDDELKAKVVELPYKLNDFRMMIILPNEMDGLEEVEKRIDKFTLKKISERLQDAEVIVKLPQFKIEFETNMIQVLQQLGLYSLFTDESRFNLFKYQEKPIIVDQIKQKSVISVNEAGTEAAAATFAKITPLSIPLGIKKFTADHPFLFVIRNSKAPYFIGHVVNF